MEAKANGNGHGAPPALASPRPPGNTGGDGGQETLREHYLQRLLALLETGRLEPYEYTRRVRALETATSPRHMAEIVDAPVPQEPTLDAVDMLMTARRTPERVPGGKRPRFWWLAVMAFFFVVLLLLGAWLVGHARSLHNSGNTGSVVPALSVGSFGPASS